MVKEASSDETNEQRLGDGEGRGLVKANDAAVRWGTRIARQPDGSVVFDWPAVYASFKVRKGNQVMMTLTDTTVTGTAFSVMVDGEKVNTIWTQPGRETYVLLPQGWTPSAKHEEFILTVQHMQEPMFIKTDANHNLTIHHFETDGQVVASPFAKRKIEFIGDSGA